MPDPTTLLLFALASATLVAIPGPAVIYIVTRGVTQGRTAGVISAMGIEAGALLHVAAAVAGLSAIVASSATALAVLKYAGAAYLVLLGIQKLRSSTDGTPLGELPRHKGWRLFRQGMVVNVLNPKILVFHLAFLPQFVDPDRGSVALQVAVLGMLFVAVAAALDCLWAVAAGTVGDRLRRSVSVRGWLDRISGATYLGLGVAAALSRRP